MPQVMVPVFEVISGPWPMLAKTYCTFAHLHTTKLLAGSIARSVFGACRSEEKVTERTESSSEYKQSRPRFDGIRNILMLRYE
jgi:hypothetical protein